MKKTFVVLLSLILIAFALNVVLYNYSRGYGKFVVVNEDDAYISMRYAQNLVDTHGLVWNIGEKPVEGYTCFLWVLLLALVGKLGGDMVLWSKILQTAFAVGGILVACFIPRRFHPIDNRRLAGLMVAFVLAFNPSWVYWATSGMESSLFAFLILLGLFLVIDERLAPARLAALSVVLALATLTRPEGGLFLAIVVSYVFIRHLTDRAHSLIPALAATILPALLILGPYVLWRYCYYGYLLPNTFYAKTGGDCPGMAEGTGYLLRFMKDTPWIVLVPFAPIVLPREKLKFCLVLVAIVLYGSYVVSVGGDWMPLYRFFVPILPWLAVCLGLLAATGLGRVLARRKSRAAKLLLIVGTFAAVFYLNGRALYRSAYRSADASSQLNSRFVAVGKHLAGKYPSDAEAALFPVGAISYYSGLKVIDMHGLNDVHIAHLKAPNFGDVYNDASVPLLTGAAGHCKTDIPYVLARRPTLLIGEPDLTFDPSLPSKWDVEKIFASYPRDEYELVIDRIFSPGDPFFERGVFLRYLRLRSFSGASGSSATDREPQQ